MALEKITEKTKYEEYKKKLQQNLAVKTIHQYNHKNSPHKENHINNLTQFQQYDNKSCNKPNSSKSNNTSLSVSFYVAFLVVALGFISPVYITYHSLLVLFYKLK